MIDREPGRVGQPGDVGQPALSTRQFGDRIVETVGGHREQRGLVRRGESGARGAGTDRSTDAEFLPQSAGGKHDAEFEHPLDVDLRDVLCAPAGSALSPVEHAIDAVHQPFQCGAVDLIGAAEIVHHARFRPLGIGVPDALGQGVVGDR